MSSSPSNPRLTWSDLWVRDQTLRHVVRKMRRSSLSLSSTPPSDPDDTNPTLYPDPTLSLSDQTLTLIFSLLPPHHHATLSLTCKRWLRLSGLSIQSLTLFDFEFLKSGRVSARFPNLTRVNTLPACIRSVSNSGIRLTNTLVSISLDSNIIINNSFISRNDLLDSSFVDRGIRVLTSGCPNLQKLSVINASENGLSCIARECDALQDLELHSCGDVALKGISGCRNLQILKIVGFFEGFYENIVSDIGLTIVAQGCKRLVRLELVGCEGSYDGIKAIGQCCQMLEEITFNNHKMDGGWLAGLNFCSNLKTLKLYSCKNVDLSPGLDEYLGSIRGLEELYLKRCRMRDKMGVRALFLVCEAAREIYFEDCWGLDDNVLQIASVCRRVRLLSLEGCSLLTMVGLEVLVLSWTELSRLRVVSCNNIKDSEITSALASLFSVLKELKWRPDSRSLLAEGLEGTGMGMKKRR